MVHYLRSTLNKAHDHCNNNFRELENSKKCGCIYCFEIYDPIEILDNEHSLWLDESTATCAKCGIDSVIGDGSGYPVTDRLFLELMGFVWFNGYARGHDKRLNYTALNKKLENFIVDDIQEK
jgi:hypothetical protein